MHLLKVKKSYKTEFKKQLRFAITAAIGFTIAYGWRNAIYNSMQQYVIRVLDVLPEHYLTDVYTALALSLVGVLFIFISAWFLKG